MQEIVNYLVENPDVLEKVVSGHASLLGVDAKDVISMVEGFMNTGKSVAGFWL